MADENNSMVEPPENGEAEDLLPKKTIHQQVIDVPDVQINKALIGAGAVGVVVVVFLAINLFMSPIFDFSAGAAAGDDASSKTVEVAAGDGGGGGGGGGGAARGGGGASVNLSDYRDTRTETWHKCTICGTDCTGMEERHFRESHNGRGSYTIEERTLLNSNRQ